MRTTQVRSYPKRFGDCAQVISSRTELSYGHVDVLITRVVQPSLKRLRAAFKLGQRRGCLGKRDFIGDPRTTARTSPTEVTVPPLPSGPKVSSHF